MVAQVRGVQFIGAGAGLAPRPDNRDLAMSALEEVAKHLGFAPRWSLYVIALQRLKRTIFDRATRTKWQRKHANG